MIRSLTCENVMSTCMVCGFPESCRSIGCCWRSRFRGPILLAQCDWFRAWDIELFPRSLLSIQASCAIGDESDFGQGGLAEILGEIHRKSILPVGLALELRAGWFADERQVSAFAFPITPVLGD